MKRQALLHLLHLVSPALPVGAYAYSQGLEYAIDSGIVQKATSIPGWLAGVARFGLGRLDLPVLARLHEAWSERDIAKVRYWNGYLRAARETHELLLEDEQMGLALNRLLRSFAIEGADTDMPACYASQFALAANHWALPLPETLLGFAYSWLENQMAAATKLAPLGQTQAQTFLLELLGLIETVCDEAMNLPDDAIGFSLPGLALASARHERQYSRLFRS